MKRFIRTKPIAASSVYGSHMSTRDLIRYGTLADFEQYVKDYDTDKTMKYTEAVRFDLNAVRKFLKIRDKYQYADDWSEGDWYEIDIGGDYHTKYGTNFIYVDPTRKIWRTRQNPSEFYGHHYPEFNV